MDSHSLIERIRNEDSQQCLKEVYKKYRNEFVLWAVRHHSCTMAAEKAPVDYVNTHGTSTPVGDIAELDAMREVFDDRVPPFSSSKSLCGHSLGAAGVQEAIHCLLMLENGFMAGSVNIYEADPKAAGLPILRESRDNPGLNTVMSNNFGFGGTNACIVFRRP